MIVFDIVRFAKKNDINVGPGRGSSAGSLVCYVLGITEIDPIIYNTYFERFLNPERKSLPDIDLDFEDSRRNEVIEYAFRKYSIHNVVSIITFQKYTLNFHEVMRSFNTLPPDIEPTATGHINEQISMVEKILKNG